MAYGLGLVATFVFRTITSQLLVAIVAVLIPFFYSITVVGIIILIGPLNPVLDINYEQFPLRNSIEYSSYRRDERL
jgi:hypothetical protein